jgi:hypothetical protein
MPKKKNINVFKLFLISMFIHFLYLTISCRALATLADKFLSFHTSTKRNEAIQLSLCLFLPLNILVCVCVCRRSYRMNLYRNIRISWPAQ